MLAAALAMAVIAACRQEIAFTATPVDEVAAVQAPSPGRIEARIAAAIDMAPVAAAIEKELPETMAKLVEWIDDAACLRRNKSLECTSARVDGRIVRDGPARLEVGGGRVIVVVPLKYELAIRGIQWASELRDRKSGRLSATLGVEAGLDASLAPAVKAAGKVELGEATVPILKGRLALGRFVDQRLRRARDAAVLALRKSLAGSLSRALLEQAWVALHGPIQLTREPPAWLAPEPLDVSLAELGEEGGTTRISAAIGMRAHTVAGKVPLGRRPTALPPAHRVPSTGAPGRGSINLPVVVPIEPLEQAIRAAFRPDEVIRTRADADRADLAVRVGAIRLFPARRHLGIALAMTVAEPATWAGLEGRAYLMARPGIDLATGRLGLSEVVFPDAAGRGAPGGGPQIGIEPFASRLKAAARLELGSWFASLAERASGRRMLGNGLALDLDVRHAGGTRLVPEAGGLRVDLELDGTLAVVKLPPGDGAAAMPAPTR